MQIIAPDLGIRNRPETKLLLHPDGADQSTSFFDMSRGSAAKSPVQGAGSGYFNGSASLYLADSTDWSGLCGAIAWTIESDVYLLSVSSSYALFSRFNASSPYTGFYIDVSFGHLRLIMNGSAAITSTTVVSANTWYHVAFVCDGSTVKLYINGVQDASTSSTMLVNYATSLLIGVTSQTNEYFAGRMSEIRISNVARYAAAFTPPTNAFTADSYTKLLIHFNDLGSATVTDSSSSAKTITNTYVTQIQGNPITAVGNACVKTMDLRHQYARSAIFFPGSASYLSAPYTSDLALASGDDFTIEGWVRRSSNTAFELLSNALDPAATSTAFLFLLNDTGILYFLIGTGSGGWSLNLNSGAEIVALHAWAYVGVKRASGVTTLWINGSQVATSSASFSSAGAVNAYIGNYAATYAAGYIGELRYSKGIARDLSVVPTAPLPSDSYTRLLVRGDNVTQPTTFKDLSPSAHTITTSGSVTTVPLPPGPSAVYYDGTGDGLITPYSSDFNFSTENFTLHFWANPSPSDASHGIFAMFNDANNDFQVSIRNGPPFGLRIYSWASGSCVLNVNTPASILADVYSHIAIVRYGAGQNNLAISINGKFQALTWGVNMPAGYTMPNYSNIVIGADTANSDYMAGCLKEFTVVKGRALWSHDFTPPSRAA